MNSEISALTRRHYWWLYRLAVKILKYESSYHLWHVRDTEIRLHRFVGAFNTLDAASSASIRGDSYCKASDILRAICTIQQILLRLSHRLFREMATYHVASKHNLSLYIQGGKSVSQTVFE